MSSEKQKDRETKEKQTENQEGDTYWQEKLALEKKGIKRFKQTIYRKWCKSCGLCIALCPKDVYGENEDGGPEIIQPDHCIGCLICETHCPDFAITIEERYPDRRRKK